MQTSSQLSLGGGVGKGIGGDLERELVVGSGSTTSPLPPLGFFTRGVIFHVSQTRPQRASSRGILLDCLLYVERERKIRG